MTLENAHESWDFAFSKSRKNFFFKRLQNVCLKKKFPQMKKIQKFSIFDFRQKKHLEVVFATSNFKKWIFWMILHILCPGKFFHTTFSFFSKSAWNFQFFENFQNFVKNCRKSWNLDLFIHTFWALKLPKMIIFPWDRFHSKV